MSALALSLPLLYGAYEGFKRTGVYDDIKFGLDFITGNASYSDVYSVMEFEGEKYVIFRDGNVFRLESAQVKDGDTVIELLRKHVKNYNPLNGYQTFLDEIVCEINGVNPGELMPGRSILVPSSITEEEKKRVNEYKREHYEDLF